MSTNQNNKDQEKSEKTVTNSTPKNFIVPFLLLSLRNWNLHGYKLIQQLIDFGFSSIDQGNVYRTLRQLEKDNLIKSEWDTSSGGPAKRVYSITKAGEQYLDSWANSLEQYQSMLDQFFSIYTSMFLPSNTKLNHEENRNEKK